MAATTTLMNPHEPRSGKTAEGRDAELMRKVCRGDAAAFEALYLEIHPRLFRFIVRMIRSPEMAEDLVNETMLVVWEKPEGFDFSCQPSTWIFGIAYRKALKASAQNLKTSALLSVDDMSEVLADRAVSASRQVELDDLLAVALATLPAEQRAVVELTYHHGLPYRDIAEILDCPENTVKTRMFNARRKLEPFLQHLTPSLEDYRLEESP